MCCTRVQCHPLVSIMLSYSQLGRAVLLLCTNPAGIETHVCCVSILINAGHQKEAGSGVKQSKQANGVESSQTGTSFANEVCSCED